ncbi:hypothetical protein Tco_1389654 [Tanacetum coccineum]
MNLGTSSQPSQPQQQRLCDTPSNSPPHSPTQASHSESSSIAKGNRCKRGLCRKITTNGVVSKPLFPEDAFVPPRILKSQTSYFEATQYRFLPASRGIPRVKNPTRLDPWDHLRREERLSRKLCKKN